MSEVSSFEGGVLGVEEVRSTARRLGLDMGGLPKAARDVEGVMEMMLDATQHLGAPLTKERLFGWHASLFPTGGNNLMRITVGAWRTDESGAMQVISGPVGREKVHFVAPTADRLDPEMERFIGWFNKDTSNDPVLKTGIAHFWFVTLHPFENGNGRTAQAIADMAFVRGWNKTVCRRRSLLSGRTITLNWNSLSAVT